MYSSWPQDTKPSLCPCHEATRPGGTCHTLLLATAPGSFLQFGNHECCLGCLRLGQNHPPTHPTSRLPPWWCTRLCQTSSTSRAWPSQMPLSDWHACPSMSSQPCLGEWTTHSFGMSPQTYSSLRRAAPLSMEPWLPPSLRQKLGKERGVVFARIAAGAKTWLADLGKTLPKALSLSYHVTMSYLENPSDAETLLNVCRITTLRKRVTWCNWLIDFRGFALPSSKIHKLPRALKHTPPALHPPLSPLELHQSGRSFPSCRRSRDQSICCGIMMGTCHTRIICFGPVPHQSNICDIAKRA